MKVGDLVKRSIEWVEDGFLTEDEIKEIGIIAAVYRERPDGQKVFIVHWPSCGMSYDDAVDLEVLNESW